jgi:hypothetical protein
MNRRKLAPPAHHADLKVWQAELLRTSHLTLREKLIALALSKRLTTHAGDWVDLDEIAHETGQSIADVQSTIDQFNGTLITVLDT